MTQSFSCLCITNAICMTSLWIFIALGIFVTQMQRDKDILDLFGKMSENFVNVTMSLNFENDTMSLNFENVTMSLNFEKDNIHFTNKSLKIENNAKEASYYYLPFQSLKTISRSLIWLEFVLDNAVCFTEFMVVGLKVQAPPVRFYLISALRYVIYFLHAMVWYDFMSVTFASESIQLFLCLWTLNRIMCAVAMCCMNKELSNKVDGISNPVVHAIGPTGNKAMAGA